MITKKEAIEQNELLRSALKRLLNQLPEPRCWIPGNARRMDLAYKNAYRALNK